MVELKQYQIRALRQNEGDNLQLKVILGMVLSLGIAGAASPVAGLVFACWVWYRSAREARESGQNCAAILDGTFAHSLDEEDFREYVALVGDAQVKSELESAIARNLPISSHAKQFQLPAQLVLRGAEPQVVNKKVQDQISISDVEPTPKFKDPEFIAGFNLESLVEPLDNKFILGTGGAGKGVLVSNLLRLAQSQDPGLKIFVIDPKGEQLESGYWDSCDHVERNQVASMASAEVIEWLDNCLDKYNSWLAVVEQSGGRGLLIIDELLILGHHSKNQKYNRIGSLIIHVASLGDVVGRKVWLITQTPYVTGVGLTLSQTSQIPWVCLIGSTNPLRQWGTSKTLAPITPDQLQKLRDSSPVGRAIMVGDQWYPMPRLQNYSGVDRDSKKSDRGIMSLVIQRVATNPVYKSWQTAINNSGCVTPEKFCTDHNLDCTPAQLELIRECFYAQATTIPKPNSFGDNNKTDLRVTVGSGNSRERVSIQRGGAHT